jgi:hypothetical protein
MRRCASVLSTILSVLASVIGCASDPTLDASTAASVTLLDTEFLPQARLGKLPVSVDTREPIARYSLQPAGRSPEYLLVVAPSQLDGKLTMSLKGVEGSIESAAEYNSYLDLLLRAHRQLLRGELADAKDTLASLDGRFDVTYGGLVMRGNLAYLEGDGASAATLYESARRILPQAPPLEGLTP